MKKTITSIISLSVALVLCACAANSDTKGNCPLNKQGCQTQVCPCPNNVSGCPAKASMKTTKLTKEMFYKNGKFDEAAAKQAYFDMMTNLGYPISENMRNNMWASDFGLGDFPAVGMGGIFWAHENKHGVFGHEILLLPNQMLIEHCHIAGKGLPAKNECWMARAGMSYCVGENGEDISKFPQIAIPESQKNFTTVKNVGVACSKKGNVIWMGSPEAKHFMIAGPKGAVVTEYGAFHDSENNRYTNPNVKF